MCNNGFKWPQHKTRGGKLEDDVAALAPQLGIYMCKSCWNGDHPQEGCIISGYQCRCYRGRAKGLPKPHKPSEGCTEQANIADLNVGTIKIG